MSADLGTRIADMDFRASFVRESKLRRQLESRIKNSLQRTGTMTLGQLVDLTEDELPEGIGVVSTEVIKAQLRTMGLALKVPDGP